MDDLRQWLQKVDSLGQLKVAEGADWDLEIGAVTALNAKRPVPAAVLFDKIKGYPEGYRVLSGSLSSPQRVSLTYNLPVANSTKELLQALQTHVPRYQREMAQYPRKPVKTGAVLENIDKGEQINLYKFPVPRWHANEPRYIGTGDIVITRDPDTGAVNCGTYRIMVHDAKTTALSIVPGHHGRLHYDKYHVAGKKAPVAVSVGHHPIFFAMGAIEIPHGSFSEYEFAGAILGESIPVIEEEVTGLPIPANSEIVIAGFSPPDKRRSEGPFGEWTGYYATTERTEPIIEVERVYYRNNPILLGSPPDRTPHDYSYYIGLMRSVMLYNQLVNAGIPDVRGVWLNEIGLQQFIVISIKQKYAGHAKQAALLASQGRVGANMGRYVVVVDEDIDPTDMTDVIWALCSRSDPETDIDIIRRSWSNALDTMIRKPTAAYFNSRAIIDACKPFDWINEFPKEISMSPELVEKVKKKWGGRLSL